MKAKSGAPIFAPASETQRIFLNDDSDVTIFGGGKDSASTLKTLI